jgi:hypothetical protein
MSAATSTTTTAAAAHPGESAAAAAPEPPGNDVVLHRLKELEESNAQNAQLIERMRKEAQDKEEKIKMLSADKRKEMETILSSAIDNWLNSLEGVSDDHKRSFRSGISKLAEQADMNNAAWEIVCNASSLHNNNVKKIEELLTEAKERERQLGDLQGFRTEASRISSGPTAKRARIAEEPPPAVPVPGEASASAGSSSGGDAWDTFQAMISKDFRSNYF